MNYSSVNIYCNIAKKNFFFSSINFFLIIYFLIEYYKIESNYINFYVVINTQDLFINLLFIIVNNNIY